MSFLEKFTIGYALFIIILAILVAIGWVMNVIDLVRWNADITAEFIIRVIGIFVPPLGAIMGWFI